MSNPVPCPDPSLHRDTKLQEQASTAALYATSPARNRPNAEDILDKDNKLSSRSAATSLKHARPEDLPSFPSSGGVPIGNSNDAALLAAGNHKDFEHWKPEQSSAAGKAASLANGYKMAPLWQPEMSAAGSKAALLAAKDGGKVDIWTPEPSANGNSAAAQAFRNSTLHSAPGPIVTADIRSKALLAATKSVSRARSGSTPTAVPANYPDAAKSAYNALNAATVANRRPSTNTSPDDVMSSPALEQSRIKHLSSNIPREMFTEHPPVDIEVQEKRHNDALRASAVSMAKQMYNLQQKDQDPASRTGATAATTAAGRSSSSAPPDLKQQALQYIHLQEAAQKLAEERLAKMDPDGAARYREHYGYPLKSERRRLSMRDKYRRTANNDAQDSDSDDELTSRRIRNQMSQFNKELESVDEKKRQSDRAAVFAAAERKVQAQMHSMDEKVFAETGKVSPAMMEEWEAKAREKAMRDSAKRTENYGKTDIGGGRFMDRSEIEAIAAARLKPTLDEITENAERRRAKDEELRLAQEERKFQEVKGKLKEKDVKTEQKLTRQEEKAAAKQEKEQQKTAAKNEKYRQAEEKRTAREDQRKSREVKKEVIVVPVIPIVAEESKMSELSPIQGTADEEPIAEHTTSVDTPRASDLSERPSGLDTAVVIPAVILAETADVSAVDEEKAVVEPAAIIIPAAAVVDEPITRASVVDSTTSAAVPVIATSSPTKEELQQSKSPRGFGKFMDRLKRRSGHNEQGSFMSSQSKSPTTKSLSTTSPDLKTEESKTAVPEPTIADVILAQTSATLSPTDKDVAPLSAVEAQAVAAEHTTAVGGSPSSFVRRAKDDRDDVSSLSALSSDEDVFGEASTGLGHGDKILTLGEGEGKEALFSEEKEAAASPVTVAKEEIAVKETKTETKEESGKKGFWGLGLGLGLGMGSGSASDKNAKGKLTKGRKEEEADTAKRSGSDGRETKFQEEL